MVEVPELDELEEVWDITDAPRELPEQELPPLFRRVAMGIAFALAFIILVICFVAVVGMFCQLW